MKTKFIIMVALLFSHCLYAQSGPARAIIESAAEAMGGVERLQNLDNIVLTGFGQVVSQQGGGNLSSHVRAPMKWEAINAAQRSFDLKNELTLDESRRSSMFPYAIAREDLWAQASQVQTGIDVLDHPLTAVLKALAADTQLGTVRTEDDLIVVEFTTAEEDTLWLAIDSVTRLPAWVRWIEGSTTLGDVSTTAYFTGYLPFEGIWLPVGLTRGIDWRDTTVFTFNVDSYHINVADLEPINAPEGGFGQGNITAEATVIADGVWDVRYGGNGSAVMEFDDHLTMFEAYGNEAATFARLDLANSLVPGKEVTEVIVSHHHFDHSGGLRAAVSRGLTIISHRGNEDIFQEMVNRPAPNFPDALARNPQPLKFVAVDEQLTLDDGTMRVDVYHAVGHLHMADAVVAYVPEHGVFAEGDFTTFNWDWHWWGGAYLDTVDLYGLDPAINIPVHGIVTSFDEAISTIEQQVENAKAYCAETISAGFYFAGCPVQYSRD